MGLQRVGHDWQTFTPLHTYRHTEEYYSALKKNEALMHATIWTDLGNTSAKWNKQSQKVLAHCIYIQYSEYGNSLKHNTDWELPGTPGPQTVTLLGSGVAADVWSYWGPGGGVDAGQMLWAPHPLLRAHVSMRNTAAVRLGQRRWRRVCSVSEVTTKV